MAYPRDNGISRVLCWWHRHRQCCTRKERFSSSRSWHWHKPRSRVCDYGIALLIRGVKESKSKHRSTAHPTNQVPLDRWPVRLWRRIFHRRTGLRSTGSSLTRVSGERDHFIGGLLDAKLMKHFSAFRRLTDLLFIITLGPWRQVTRDSYAHQSKICENWVSFLSPAVSFWALNYYRGCGTDECVIQLVQLLLWFVTAYFMDAIL